MNVKPYRFVDPQLFSILGRRVYNFRPDFMGHGPLFEGEGGGEGGAGGTGGAGGAGSGEGGAGGAGGAGAGGSGGGQEKTFTEDQVNSIVKDRLAKKDAAHKEELQKQLKMVEELQKKTNLTEEEKQHLQQRADELSDALMSEKDKAAKEREKLDKQHKEELKSLTGDRDSWKDRFTRQTIDNEILTESSAAKVYNPSQMLAIVGPLTQLVEEKDEKLNPTGKLIVRVVDVMMKNEEGKVEKRDQVPVKEYIEYLATQEEYANLFRSDRPGGTGWRPGTSGSAPGKDLSSKGKIAAGLKANRMT